MRAIAILAALVTGCVSTGGSARVVRISQTPQLGGVVAFTGGEDGLRKGDELARGVCAGPFDVVAQYVVERSDGIEARRMFGVTHVEEISHNEVLVTFRCR